MFFPRKKRKDSNAAKKAEIHAVRQDMYGKIDKVNVSVDKVNNFLEKDLGVTESIFFATGGGKQK